MSGSLLIRTVETQKDKDALKKLATYAFANTGGWIDRLFPLEEGSQILGAFEDGALISSVASRFMFSRLLGKDRPTAGIAMVLTVPEARNKGLVKDLMSRVLRSEHEKGREASFLYPFKFPFYERMGYGYAGGVQRLRFEPSDLLSREKSGNAYRWEGDLKELGEALALKKVWAGHFEGGVLPDKTDLDRWAKLIESNPEHHLYLFEQEGEMRGYLDYILFHENGKRIIDVWDVVWRGLETMDSILEFLRAHRDQVHEIRLTLPKVFPFPLMTKSKRMLGPVQGYHDWMFRVLKLETLLQDKQVQTNFQGQWAFSVKDPILESNTGTYSFSDGKLSFQKSLSEQEIPISAISSLLLGAVDFKQAKWADLIPGDFPEPDGELFPLKPNIYLGKAF
jgi:predicted acetyltransferase